MENRDNSVMWWGYIHINGELIIKRYYDSQDVILAHDSPFVVKVLGPIKSDNRVDAENSLRQLI